MRMSMKNNRKPSEAAGCRREEIERILQEEDQYFINCHHHAPVGRESEDVVDNAYARILHLHPMPYVAVSTIYNEMRCQHA